MGFVAELETVEESEHPSEGLTEEKKERDLGQCGGEGCGSSSRPLLSVSTGSFWVCQGQLVLGGMVLIPTSTFVFPTALETCIHLYTIRMHRLTL